MTQPRQPDGDYTELLNRAVDDIREGIQAAIDVFNRIADQVQQYVHLLGPAALLWIRRGLEHARDGVRTVHERVQYALDHQLPVISLIRTSFRWIDEVKTPLSDMSQRAVGDEDVRLVKWSGDAASAYRTMAGVQKGAIDDVTGKAEFMSQWLFKIAKANVDYAVELAKIVTDLVGALATAASQVGTVVTIPWAIAELEEQVGSLVKAGLNNLLTLTQRFVDALGYLRDLQGQVGDHSKLTGGKWPQAVRG